ncbi:MAG: Asp-tRNA(Asn)/Glu-tRNA(Gln) amidotransferase subunit GatA [Spirochaetae bacterium HGW-Spirochaetae-3]|jgi:aspartyl-tRNA(Asn)/glutamyl-tRNA(Gln) amidotransferase subunit A|nr:MAG: Asp-tRNA(Asn)/Glu-tRNA(Gln) amidotransferase subunit GatA [Spirochaetae bacterium HGW-Spirochaetae-3]
MSRTVLQDGFSAYLDAWEARIGSFLEKDAETIAGSAVLGADREPGYASDSTKGVLRGLPFGVKDNIAVKDMRLSCGSRLLDGFRSPYSATAVARLAAVGAMPAGKTNMDEFGMGSSTDNSAFMRTNNPWDVERVAGGSSGGSAAAVAAGLVPFALGSDTGGSVRQPANFCGVVGLKPTYGAVSRFGLVAYASSLETIGVLADSVARARTVFAAMRGADPLDQTSFDAPADAPSLLPLGGKPAEPRAIGVLSPSAVAKALASTLSGQAGPAGNGGPDEAAREASAAAMLEPEVALGFEAAKEGLRALGHRLVDVELPSLKYGVPAYYTIATAEASANLARFDGIRYGNRPAYAENPDGLIDGARGSGFGDEVKLRILLGTFVLRSGFQDRYYLRAQRIRTGIRLDFNRVLAGVDAVLMPVFPTRAFGRGERGLSPFAQKAADLFTCCANLAGLPALAFPTGVEGGLPVGVQLVGKAFGEGLLLDVAEGYEAAHPIARPAGYRAFWG